MAVPNHKQTVEDIRRGYGQTMSKDQCVALCNAVAWRHRGEGFGVAEKTSGTHGTRRDGVQCAIDGLVYRPPSGGTEQFIDILGNADGTTPPAAVPTWQEYATSNRKWIAPISPDPTPEPPDPPDPPAGDYVTRAEYTAFKLTTQAQLAQLRADLSNLARQVQDIDDRVDALEHGTPSPAPTPQRYVLVGDPTAPPVGVSSELFHSHVLRARVEPVP